MKSLAAPGMKDLTYPRLYVLQFESTEIPRYLESLRCFAGPGGEPQVFETPFGALRWENCAEYEVEFSRLCKNLSSFW